MPEMRSASKPSPTLSPMLIGERGARPYGEIAIAPSYESRSAPRPCYSSLLPSVTDSPSDWSSLTSTLNDSGMPGSGRFSPFTIAS